MRCDVCRAKVTELRRGRCWGCYNRWVDERPVGVGARCVICSERRRAHLRSVELLGAWMPVCYTCAGRAARLHPMPQSIAGIRHALRRERRRRERRYGKRDTRVFQYERRSGDRRDVERVALDDLVAVDDEMILDIELEDAMLARDRDGDLTRIRQLPAQPPPIPQR